MSQTKVQLIDVNGLEVILDADADTSITSDTDDQIDIKIGGADDFAFKANNFEVQSGSTIDMIGQELILDADADTSITADTDDTIDFKTGGTDRMRIESGGNIGIGTSSASALLHIMKADSSALNDGNADDLMLEGTSAVGMTIGSSNSGEGHIRFSDSDDADVCSISYFHSDNYLQFRVDAGERMRISDAGLHIGGTTDANALDEYEEGTWTPSGPSLGVATTHKAIYRKIGDIVIAYCDITYNASPSDVAQATSLSGLPFSSNDSYTQCNTKVATRNQVIEAEVSGSGVSFRDKADGGIMTRSECADNRTQHMFVYTTA